jgi:protein SCO1/2
MIPAIAGIEWISAILSPMRIWLPALAILVTACARRHSASGLILAVQPNQLLISHREIPKVMPAMTMPIPTKNTQGLKPGDQIDFTLKIGKRKSEAVDIRRRATLGEGLTDGMALKRPEETVPLQAPMPDFALTDQEGVTRRLETMNGNTVAVNFIYTRCPLPEVCPRLTSHFARLQRRFEGKPVRFLTITLDPQYDTQAVLKDYARKWRADPSRWHLLTGAKDQVDLVARRFGMLYWPEQGQLTHTSVTGVIDPQGRLVARIEGSSYDASQLGDLIEQCVTSSSSPPR